MSDARKASLDVIDDSLGFDTPAKALKNRVAGRGRKESAQKVAPTTDPPG